jgi:hypothetical protein
MPEYKWSEAMPATPRVPAQVFGETLERLANDQIPPRLVPPKTIVDYARSRRSPIHKLFMWDDARAGERFRWMQARKFVSVLEIVLVQVKGARAVSTRGFWSVTDGKQRGYASRHRILSERDLQLQVIHTARVELESYINKYAGVISMGTFIPQLETIVDAMRKTVSKLEARATKERHKV